MLSVQTSQLTFICLSLCVSPSAAPLHWKSVLVEKEQKLINYHFSSYFINCFTRCFLIFGDWGGGGRSRVKKSKLLRMVWKTCSRFGIFEIQWNFWNFVFELTSNQTSRRTPQWSDKSLRSWGRVTKNKEAKTHPTATGKENRRNKNRIIRATNIIWHWQKVNFLNVDHSTSTVNKIKWNFGYLICSQRSREVFFISLSEICDFL